MIPKFDFQYDESANCVYSLRNQTRTTHALAGETTRNVFLIGTLGLSAPNELHVLLYEDEDYNEGNLNTASPDLPSDGRNATEISANFQKTQSANSPNCSKQPGDDAPRLYSLVFRHAHEIHSISSSYATENPNIICTSYNIVAEKSSRMRSTLWRLDRNLLMNNFKEHSGSSGLELEPILTLPDTNSSSGISQVAFDTTGSMTRVVARDASSFYIYSLADGLSAALEATTVKFDSPTSSITWSPHSPPLVGVTHGSSVSLLDLRRAGANATVIKTNCPRLLALDFNPNRLYHFATGGSDGALRFFDTRNPNTPVTTIPSAETLLTSNSDQKNTLGILPSLPNSLALTPTEVAANKFQPRRYYDTPPNPMHSHWLYCCQYNRYHDMLLLTGSSDSNVLLNVCHHGIPPPVSSPLFAPLTPSIEDAKIAGGQNLSAIVPPLPEGVVASYEHHEDSVYSLAWSNATPWVFCSASFDGKVLICNVPSDIKYRIIMA